MTVVAFTGIVAAIKELLLAASHVRAGWVRDNPGQPIPDEMQDDVLIAAFAESLTGATETFDRLIGRLRERVANGS